MNMIELGSREPVEATERKRLTVVEKATLLQRQQHRCAGPCQESLIWAIVDGRPVYGPTIEAHHPLAAWRVQRPH